MSEQTKNKIKHGINAMLFLLSLLNLYIDIQQQEFIWILWDILSALLFGHLTFNKDIRWLSWF